MLYEETSIYTGAETVTKLFLCLSAVLQVGCLKARDVIDDLWLKLADVGQTDGHEKCPQTCIQTCPSPLFPLWIMLKAPYRREHCPLGSKWWDGYLLVADVLVSFLEPDPDGEGSVPLVFFGRMVPLFTVGRNGRVAIIGLAGRWTKTKRELWETS